MAIIKQFFCLIFCLGFFVPKGPRIYLPGLYTDSGFTYQYS